MLIRTTTDMELSVYGAGVSSTDTLGQVSLRSRNLGIRAVEGLQTTRSTRFLNAVRGRSESTV